MGDVAFFWSEKEAKKFKKEREQLGWTVSHPAKDETTHRWYVIIL